MKKLWRLWCICGVVVFLAGVLILPTGAEAGLVSVTITATNEIGESQIVTLGGEASFDTITGNFVWEKNGPETPILDGAIESLKLIMAIDPEVGIEFGVRAGNSVTTYSILSDIVSFTPLVNPMASASAGVTLTDRNYPANGASITGLFPGVKTHQARYNSSTVFANLVSGFSIPIGTLTTSEARPPSGSEIINDTLSSIESEFWFTLSANDSASGTSVFVVIPEPATIAILCLGGLALLKKRTA